MLPRTFRLTLTSCLQFLAINVVDIAIDPCAIRFNGESRNYIIFKSSYDSTLPPVEVLSWIDRSFLITTFPL